MRNMRNSVTTGYTVVIFLLALAMLAFTSTVSAQSNQAEYVVVADLASTPVRAIRLDTGSPPDSLDKQVVNPTNATVELRAQNPNQEYIELWVVEDVAGEWRALQINGNKFYSYADDQTRAWIQKDRGTACATAEAYSAGTFQCPAEEPGIVEGLYYLDGAGLQYFASTGSPQVTLVLGSIPDPLNFPSVQVRTEWSPTWTGANPLFETTIDEHSIYIGVSSAITAEVSAGMTRAGWMVEFERDGVGAWFYTTGHRPNADIDQPVRRVQCVVVYGEIFATLAGTGYLLDLNDLRGINPDASESQLVGSAWIVGLEIDDTATPPLRRVSINHIENTLPIYGVSEVAPNLFRGTRTWCALTEQDAQAEAWRLMESLGQIQHSYLPLIVR